MAHAILAYGNLTGFAALTGGSWVGSLPLTNLQDRRLGKVARSTSPATADTQFDADFGTTNLFRVVALAKHNISRDGQYRIRLSTVADFSTTAFDSGWTDVWPSVFAFGTLPWGAENWWTGQYSDTEIAETTATLVCILPTSTNARYLRVEIDDTANEYGYVEIGRLFAADGWQPTRNITYGASLAYENRTEPQEALSGAEYFDVRRAPRVARAGLDAMTEDEAMSVAFDLQRRIGTDREVLFIWDPDDTVNALRRQFMARLRALSPIENPGPDRWSKAFEFKELL